MAVVGCNKGPELTPVTGTVEFDGKPVESGTISFYPASGGRPAVGKLGPGGHYQLSTLQEGDGALLGEHKVTIDSRKVIDGLPEPKSLQEEIEQANNNERRPSPKVVWIVPKKYRAQATSGLTASVNQGSNEIDFKLP